MPQNLKKKKKGSVLVVSAVEHIIHSSVEIHGKDKFDQQKLRRISKKMLLSVPTEGQAIIVRKRVSSCG